MYKKNFRINYKENLEQACIFKGKADLLLNILILFFSAYSNVLLVYYGKAIFERISEKKCPNIKCYAKYGVWFVVCLYVYIYISFFLFTSSTSSEHLNYVQIVNIIQESYARHRQK